MATSRTAEGKHTKRFIVLKKNPSDTEFARSATLPASYETRELAQAAIDAIGATDIQYKVRQK
jgi:hypothetical protein